MVTRFDSFLAKISIYIIYPSNKNITKKKELQNKGQILQILKKHQNLQ
jgi:hypothetical protein